MTITYILLFLLAAKPLQIYGKEIYLASKTRDYSRLMVNLLFFGITIAVVIGIILSIKLLE